MKDQLLKGTMILTIAGFATRVIGFCYRIFLAGELGEVNLGIYQLIFPVYSICFTIYAAGIQTAVSQLISHQPKKNHGQIIKAGITLSLCLAVILSFSLFSFRTVIAHSFLGADKTAPLLFVLAFIFPFCGVTSTINGYFYGKNNAKIPAVTQIIEQLVRVVFVVSFCFYDLLPVSSLILSVAGLVIGELASNFYNMYHLIKESSFTHLFCQKAQFGNVIRMALPLTGTKLIIALLGSVESVFIPPILCRAGSSLEDALAIYGILTGIVLPFILFPGTITNSLSVLLLPAISRASGKKDNHHVRQTTSVTVRYSLLLGVLTCAVFLNYGIGPWTICVSQRKCRKTFDAACFFMPISICDNNFRQHYQWTRENGNHFCFYRNWSYHSNWLPVFSGSCLWNLWLSVRTFMQPDCHLFVSWNLPDEENTHYHSGCKIFCLAFCLSCEPSLY